MWAYIAVCGLIAWLIAIPTLGPKPDASDVWPWIIAAVGGLGVLLWGELRYLRHYCDKTAASYLVEIGFYEREVPTQKPDSRSSGDSDPGRRYWATGNYDPDRFSAAIREHGWDHLNYIRDAYGDLDTYEENKPD